MSLSSGTMAGPYRIVGPLGSGGMGEVYRARDERLGRDVAVKVLPAEVAADPERLRRFEQEARAAGQLAHPNILVVHDVGTHEGQPFLVTELLEGETLRACLHRGPLPVRKAIELGAQIAQGLAAAHERGIVHRDLKPENVFLTRDGVVKLLDFGLAKLTHPRLDAELVSSASTLAQGVDTGAGVILGTVGYMAPEQVRGQPADHRADLFALGCVLHEMVTGKRPFRGASSADTISAILSRDPPTLASAVENVSPALEGIVRRCLEKRPEDRFQSTRDLAFDLSSLLTSGVVWPAVAGPRLRRRVFGTTALVLVALVATVLVLWSPWRARPPAVTLDPKRVVIAAFENRTGDASLDVLGTLVPEALAQGASGIGDFTAIPSPASPTRGVVGRDTASGQQALHQLGQETGAGVVVSGAYYLLGEDLRVQSQLTDAADGRLIHTAEAVTGPRAAQAELVEKLRQRVLGAVAAHFDPMLSHGQMRWPLLDAYLEWRGMEARDYSQEAMRQHLEHALDLDPDFFFPAYFLCWQYQNICDCDKSASVLRRFAGRQGRLTPYERLLYSERRADLEGRFNEQLRLMMERAVLTPADLDLKYRIGLYELFVRQPHESMATLKEVSLSHYNPVLETGNAWEPLYFLCLAHHRLREYEDELAVAQQAEQQSPGVLELRAREVAALAALGRLADADRIVEAVTATPAQMGSLGMFFVMTSAELRAHGHREASRRVAERAVAWFAGQPSSEQPGHRPLQILALALAGRWPEASHRAELLPEAPGRAWDYLTVFWGHPAVYRLGWIGSIAARLGDEAQARRVAGQLHEFKTSCPDIDRTYWRAAIATQLGTKDEAMRLFEEAVARESPMVWQADHDVLLEPLWDEPRFRTLVRPYETQPR